MFITSKDDQIKKVSDSLGALVNDLQELATATNTSQDRALNVLVLQLLQQARQVAETMLQLLP